MRYWLHLDDADHEAFDAAAEQVSDLYRRAPVLHDRGIHVVCCDEKTGIQALERASPPHFPIPGSIERQDAHYIRHGTRTLIANFEVATGEVISPSIGPTRNEQDFVNHISRTVALDPDAAWIFIVDNLNIHVSEALVRFVADLCDPQLDIGIKGRSGILRSMATRMDFLTDNQHRIRFVYTPKRASWLNQIELWFSILVRRLRRRASFVSVQHLSDRIRAFISYFNKTMAKPFKWTYRGRPLAI